MSLPSALKFRPRKTTLEIEKNERPNTQVNDPPPGPLYGKGLPGGSPGGGEGAFPILTAGVALGPHSLDAFRHSGLVLVVRSSVLGEEVTWAADGTAEAGKVKDKEGRPVYTADELLILLLVEGEEAVRGVHDLKRKAGRLEVERWTRPEDKDEESPIRGAA